MNRFGQLFLQGFKLTVGIDAITLGKLPFCRGIAQGGFQYIFLVGIIADHRSTDIAEPAPDAADHARDGVSRIHDQVFGKGNQRLGALFKCFFEDLAAFHDFSHSRSLETLDHFSAFTLEPFSGAALKSGQ